MASDDTVRRAHFRQSKDLKPSRKSTQDCGADESTKVYNSCAAHRDIPQLGVVLG